MADQLYQNNQLILDSSNIEPGSIAWKSPSNIALIKYWGKYGEQLPRNPSVSFTLEQAFTEMAIEWELKEASDRNVEVELYFDLFRHEAFEERIRKTLTQLGELFPFLFQLKLTIHSSNSFPHSSGIASSASSMSALALCLCSMEDEFFGTLEDDALFEQKASYVARLASGSAARSIYGKAAIWGGMPGVEGSSDLYAIPFGKKLHPVFHTFQNAILIVSSGEKKVSSTAGHHLMQDNPYAEPRYAQANQRMNQMLQALESGDVERMGTIAEQEALTLHALMMTSNPSYMLMEPSSIELIKRIRAFRADTGIPAYFTLDAGPNIHLLYPEENRDTVQEFVITELSTLCQDGLFIDDRVGEGPEQQ
jgi:diphosphomevalonate decarboxylase